MTGRIIRAELVRGPGGPLALVVLAATAGVLLVNPDWAGNWNGLAMGVRESLLLSCPLVAMAGTWAAGRQRRRQTADLLATAPRPRWQPFAASWLALTAGASLGLLGGWLTGGALVLPIATYAGIGWIWTLLVCAPALGASAAFGMAVGHFASWRLMAPITGIAAGLAMLWSQSMASGGFKWLAPVPGKSFLGDVGYAASTNALHTAWFSGLALTFLAVASLRRRILALVPAALAVAAATSLMALPVHWTTEAVAEEKVCVTNGATVCGPRHQEHLYPELAGLARPMLDKIRGVPGSPTQITYGGAEGTTLHEPTPTGALADPADERRALAQWLASDNYRCPGRPFSEGSAAAARWLLEGIPGTEGLIASVPVRDRDWVVRYYAALETCDAAAMHELVGE
ncbi:hypothetical protein HUO13_00690 [Saccharopolyspora erythraea]|uniref:hypothetical protein n=1 Tax=Saccharopolyspora erythraea TaxID=1836 RepID=UPI001BAACB55|nr:hypothetical protein [Saccharopolyspora erythraea]QUG99514.1 hypothetical protein HUO13_00690 [Saccharopolyspora erythraea]